MKKYPPLSLCVIKFLPVAFPPCPNANTGLSCPSINTNGLLPDTSNIPLYPLLWKLYAPPPNLPGNTVPTPSATWSYPFNPSPTK